MLPDLTVFLVIFFVLLLSVILDRLLFRPILRVRAEREEAVRSAQALAERSATEARAALAEFDQRTGAARAEIYKEMDEMRRAALAERADVVARTRAEAEAEVVAAGARLQADADRARRQLEADAEALGAAAAERILGRRAS